MMPKEGRKTVQVFSTNIDVLDWASAISKVSDWAKKAEGGYICICNSHSVVTAHKNPDFASTINAANMATADGAPVAWLMRRLGSPNQIRINGPDFMWKYCDYATRAGDSIYLYGSSESTLSALKLKLQESFPGLRIAGAYSPPFRPLTELEDTAIVDAINTSGAGVVWVSLGCPKQEKWMEAHRGRIRAVMIGVGAAFDYHAGTISRAPKWMQNNGLEWLHRLISEPRRLWKRYLVTNTLFIWYATRQIFLKR